MNSLSITVKGKLTKTGIVLRVLKRDYAIIYPQSVWNKIPMQLKEVLKDNLIYGNTHYLPLMLDAHETIHYDINFPIFESFIYRNELHDVIICEKSDNKAPLSYLKKYYNLEFIFKNHISAMPAYEKIPIGKKPKAILPFTFGKESLLTYALCLELGIEPILVYSQEPAHPYEENYKKDLLKKFEKKFKIKTYFIENQPGLFRYGKAFDLKTFTDLGWGTQTTLLALLTYPLAYLHGAQYILFGSEYIVAANALRILSCLQPLLQTLIPLFPFLQGFLFLLPFFISLFKSI